MSEKKTIIEELDVWKVGLDSFHECDGCKTQGDGAGENIAAVSIGFGQVLDQRTSHKEAAYILGGLVCSISERQSDPDAALDALLQNIRDRWKAHEPERLARLAQRSNEVGN